MDKEMHPKLINTGHLTTITDGRELWWAGPEFGWLPTVDQLRKEITPEEREYNKAHKDNGYT